MNQSLIKTASAACSLLLLSAPLCSALIVNGGLELTPPDTFRTVLSGQSYAGWNSVGSGDVEFCGLGVLVPAIQGQGSVDLNGIGFQGAISQTLGTSSGTAYKVRFALSGNPGLLGQPALGSKTMDLLWNGSVAGSFVFTHLPTDTQQNMRWEYHEITLYGNGNDLLTFASTTSAYNDAGPVLDDITVAVVPEPSVLVILSISAFVLFGGIQRTKQQLKAKTQI